MVGTTTTRNGRVVDANGQPVAEAFVTVEWGTAPTPEITLITDDNGCFRLGLPPGRFRVRATAPDGASATTEVGSEADDKPIVVELSQRSSPC